MYKLFKKKKLYVTLTKIQIEQTIIIFDAVFFNQEMFGASQKKKKKNLFGRSIKPTLTINILYLMLSI